MTTWRDEPAEPYSLRWVLSIALGCGGVVCGIAAVSGVPLMLLPALACLLGVLIVDGQPQG